MMRCCSALIAALLLLQPPSFSAKRTATQNFHDGHRRPGGSSTLTTFGYYYGLQPRDQLDEFANHSTTAFILNHGRSAGSPLNITALALADIADMKHLSSRSMTGILYSIVHVFGSQAKLDPNWPANLNAYWRLVQPHSAAILAFYPADEPTQLQVKSGVYGTMCKALKARAPHIPILAVVTPSATVDIAEKRLDLPEEVDWIGMDNYHCWGQAECEAPPAAGDHHCCCWRNRTMPENLGVIEKYVGRRGGKMVVVPDGMQVVHNISVRPTAAEQQLRAARNAKYFKWCDTHDRCIAMLVFLWNTVGGRETIKGVSEQPIVRAALTAIGSQIKARRHRKPRAKGIGDE